MTRTYFRYRTGGSSSWQKAVVPLLFWEFRGCHFTVLFPMVCTNLYSVAIRFCTRIYFFISLEIRKKKTCQTKSSGIEVPILSKATNPPIAESPETPM